MGQPYLLNEDIHQADSDKATEDTSDSPELGKKMDLLQQPQIILRSLAHLLTYPTLDLMNRQPSELPPIDRIPNIVGKMTSLDQFLGKNLVIKVPKWDGKVQQWMEFSIYRE